VDYLLERQETAQGLATKACLRVPPTGLRHGQSAGDKKDKARKKAFQDWALDWHKNRAEREVGGNSKPRSFAHKHTTTQPPDGGSHTLWQAATQKAKVS